MLTYLFIGLFVAAFNTLFKFYLRNEGDNSGVDPSILTFLIATILWPVAILAMIKKGITLGKNSGS